MVYFKLAHFNKCGCRPKEVT